MLALKILPLVLVAMTSSTCQPQDKSGTPKRTWLTNHSEAEDCFTISSPAALHSVSTFPTSPILIPHDNPSPSQKQVRIQLNDVPEQQVGAPVRPAPTQTPLNPLKSICCMG